MQPSSCFAELARGIVEGIIERSFLFMNPFMDRYISKIYWKNKQIQMWLTMSPSLYTIARLTASLARSKKCPDNCNFRMVYLSWLLQVDAHSIFPNRGWSKTNLSVTLDYGCRRIWCVMFWACNTFCSFWILASDASFSGERMDGVT